MKIDKTGDPIGRVTCRVNSCYYYQDGDHCMAKAIEVKPPRASSSEETDCATFISKTSY